MKTTALVGFTRTDAILWVVDECRERGCYAVFGGKKFNAILPRETIVMCKTEAEAFDLGVDQVITKESMEAA